MIGQKLSHFEITAKLGEGGMGEVYRATDSRLEREVAIKVLPEAFVADPERLTRFEREARVLASLGHSNIAGIHEVGEQDGVHFLVMELAAGDTLAEILERGPIPADAAVAIALQIARGLEEAHGRGVVHRDLKPANVRVGPDGEVKILDFGLAKALAADPAGAGPQALSISPTLTAEMTDPGVILGTAAYMSPEQARGGEVDKRTDIWAFGAVLYEMLAGEQVFGGATLTDVLAAVVTREPDLERLPPATPPRVRRLLSRCLAKDPRQRLHDIADARLVLEDEDPEAETGRAAGVRAQRTPVSALGRRLPWALSLLLAAALVWSLTVRTAAPRPGPSRLAIALSAPLSDLARVSFALSPDGTELVYVGERDGKANLYWQPVDGFEARRLPDTEGASAPFWSPDAEWIGFFARGKLLKLSKRHGGATSLCEVEDRMGAAWGTDGDIVFSDRGRLMSISAEGGEPIPVLEDPDPGHEQIFPSYVGDSRWVLYTASRGLGRTSVNALSLDDPRPRTLVENGAFGFFAPPGYLLFSRGDTVFAAPFEPERLALGAAGTPILDSAFHVPTFASTQIAAATHTLAWVPRGEALGRQLQRIDRRGNISPLLAERGTFYMPRFSPDGTRAAVTRELDGKMDVWTLEVDRGVLSRLTAEGTNYESTWSPDGQWIAYASEREEGSGIYLRDADGAGPERLLLESEPATVPISWDPSGARILFVDPGGSGENLGLVNVESGDVEELTPDEYSANGGVFSPDGLLVAYTSYESGSPRVTVRGLARTRAWPVSQEVGFMPLWSRDGNELFFLAGEGGRRMMSVVVTTEPELRLSQPRLLFEHLFGGSIGLGLRRYDVAPDGESFIFASPDYSPQINRIHLLRNWQAELLQRDG